MMRGELICDQINLNDPSVLSRVLRSGRDALALPGGWHELAVRNTYYLSTPESRVPHAPGWYFICDRNAPLYVGEAEDLDARLNSPNGSLDGFAHSKRKHDPARNFLKRCVAVGAISQIQVGIVAESCVTHPLEVHSTLGKLDRCNIEKLFGLFRCDLTAARLRMHSGASA
jgi:hypothetical protein